MWTQSAYRGFCRRVQAGICWPLIARARRSLCRNDIRAGLFITFRLMCHFWLYLGLIHTVRLSQLLGGADGSPAGAVSTVWTLFTRFSCVGGPLRRRARPPVPSDPAKQGLSVSPAPISLRLPGLAVFVVGHEHLLGIDIEQGLTGLQGLQSRGRQGRAVEIELANLLQP